MQIGQGYHRPFCMAGFGRNCPGGAGEVNALSRDVKRAMVLGGPTGYIGLGLPACLPKAKIPILL